MKDLTIALENRLGALAEMGEALGRAGVSVEGGGVFVVNGTGVAHFLFEDGVAARKALEAAGMRVLQEREVLVQRLSQGEPGQLGKISRRMAEAGVNIEVQYSDHDNNLILVVDDLEEGRAVSEAWTKARPTETAPDSAAAQRSAEHNLRAAMAERTEAFLAGDTEKVASYMAEEYLRTDVAGNVQDKTAWLEEYCRPLATMVKSGRFRWEIYEESDIRVRILGNAAFVMGKLIMSGSGARYSEQGWIAYPGSAVPLTVRFTRVFVRRDGKWLLAALHNAALPES
jgi:ketosteroid isomerase-like protein